MRERLIQYVERLFAGASGTEDIRQEILQNTLDRYDDLVAAGKAPEAAYQLAVSGIGDIREILGSPAPDAHSGNEEPECSNGNTSRAKQVHPKKRFVNRIILLISMVVWLVLSLVTGAWIFTWLIFPIAGCVRGLVSAIIDLTEENYYEN